MMDIVLCLCPYYVSEIHFEKCNKHYFVKYFGKISHLILVMLSFTHVNSYIKVVMNIDIP